MDERFSLEIWVSVDPRLQSMVWFTRFLRSLTMAVTRPFFLFLSICMFGLKTILIVINTLVELIMASINLHVNLFIWVFALVSLPLRLLTALQRERQFREQLQVALMEVECLAWERDELKKQFNVVMKEQKIMNMILAELEDDYDKAISNIDCLQKELKDMRRENVVVREVEGKGDYRDEVEETSSTEEDDTKQKEVAAVLSSIFSSILSVMVGMVTWKARDPCLSLLVALVVVVGMSLTSIIRLFSVVRNKPGSNLVALVSLNCFVLGFLSYPTLPHLVYNLYSSLSTNG